MPTTSGMNVNPFVQQDRPVGNVMGPTMDAPWNSSLDFAKSSYNPDYTQNLGRMFQSNMANRDRNVLNQLMQLNQPGMRNVTEAQAIAPSAQNYYNTRGERASALADRGLTNSGAAAISQRGLRNEFGNSILNAEVAAQNTEANRRQALLNTLSGTAQSDLALADQLAGGQMSMQQAYDAQRLGKLKDELGMVEGGVKLGASIFGAAAGASGAMAGTGVGTATGTQGALNAGGWQGGLAGYQLGSGIGNSLYGGNAPSSPYQALGQAGMGQQGQVSRPGQPNSYSTERQNSSMIYDSPLGRILYAGFPGAKR